MLEDFLEKNKLNSKIITFPSIVSIDRLIATKKLPPTRTVKVKLFNTKNNNPFMVVVPFHFELNTKIIPSIINENEFLELNSIESIGVTGYKKGFVPLLSVYGVKMIIDSSLENKSSLFCQVDDKKVLEALMEEILETNDDIIFEKIIIDK